MAEQLSPQNRLFDVGSYQSGPLAALVAQDGTNRWGESVCHEELEDFEERSRSRTSLSAVIELTPSSGHHRNVRVSSYAGPALFRQERVGRHGKPFKIYKFRTMRPEAERLLKSDPELYAKYLANGFKLSRGEDPRITKLGAVLRRYAIDEVPQLWNVLVGDMSLVGPRPVLREELTEYGPVANTYTMVFPGITGPWQISGRCDISVHADRAQLISNYVENWSLLGDAKILLRTIPAALEARGVV